MHYFRDVAERVFDELDQAKFTEATTEKGTGLDLTFAKKVVAARD